MALDTISVITYCDLNTPFARGKEVMCNLVRNLAAINEQNPKKSCALVILPDLPKDSSLRGLWEEEKLLPHSIRRNCNCDV